VSTMRTLRYGSAEWRRYFTRLPRAASARPDVDRAVAAILRAVERRGDRAVAQLTARFDRVRVAPGALKVKAADVRRLAKRADRDVVAALGQMARQIEAYHRHQLDRGFRMSFADGSSLEEVVRPLESVGLYVPGGAGAYPSSVLMNAIPARVARVPRIAVVTPPRALEENPAVAAALVIVGLEGAVYGIGGAQAVAALAYGTESVRAVAKIVGPGNAYVASAKRQVRGRVEIDHEAGPSEVVILADGSANPEWVAIDLLAQAEHGSGDETVALITPDAALAAAVVERVRAGVKNVANRARASRALRRNGAVVLVRDLEQGVAAMNAFAAEHAEVMTRNAVAIARQVVAGAVFVGHFAPVALGDYGIGPNHVLPTGGAARFSSPLSVRDFVRRQSQVVMTEAGLRRVARSVVSVANAEGFVAHAGSVAIRLSSPPKAKRASKRGKRR
jgi:histidinol dehydrogenase